jgi:hypothetical protein
MCLICCLFNDVISSSGYIVSIGRLINEWERIYKEAVRSDLSNHPDNCLEGQRKTGESAEDA